MDTMWREFCLAGLTGLGLTIVGMPAYLAWAKGHGWGQVIRGEGPAAHLSKAGTPTMGGLILLLAGLLASFWSGATGWDLCVFRACVVFCALLGVVDDLSKVLKNQNLGLRARDKLAALAVLGTLLGVWLIYSRENVGVSFPVLGFVAGSWVVLLVSLLVTSGTVNAVNLTDGLDGLAAGTVSAALLAYAAIAEGAGHHGLAVACVGLAGACWGFLWFNSYPARVFMGDTGSLGLGGALAAVALLTQTEMLLVLVGGVFVLEALSVIIQVCYFKATKGKRIFRMTPIHHHFELGGWHEVQVTARFVLVGVILAILGVLLYFGAAF